MKKIILIALMLIAAGVGFRAWSQSTPTKKVPDWVLEHQKDEAAGKHGKKAKPPRKIAGTAVKGAKQVSPPPKVKKSN